MTSSSPADLSADHSPVLYTADFLFTGMGGAQSPGGVVVSRGTVAATGHPDLLRQNYPQAQEIAVGGVIAPPPVNAHTHLDMSAYGFQALPYFRWIPEVVVAQKELRGVTAAQIGADTLAALRQPVGDIVWGRRSWKPCCPARTSAACCIWKSWGQSRSRPRSALAASVRRLTDTAVWSVPAGCGWACRRTPPTRSAHRFCGWSVTTRRARPAHADPRGRASQ
ncbi:hypothetical protein [Deinococcus radiophilus]|uniref:hypothetical protein n=1 Tax=Deinococcus radiophilus TaxID=32062 RepID=UPI0036236E57